MRPICFVLVAGIMQAALTTALPSPWWVPDLVLVAMVLVITRRREDWVLAAAAAALWHALWAARVAAHLALAYLLTGWVVRLIAGHVDTQDWRVQIALAAAGCGLVTFGALWIEGRWSVGLLGLAIMRTLVTGGAVAVMRGLIRERQPPWLRRAVRRGLLLGVPNSIPRGRAGPSGEARQARGVSRTSPAVRER